MNKPRVLNILGKIILTEALLMLPSLVVSLIYGDGDYWYFLVTMFPAAILGFCLSRVQPREAKMTSRDGYCIVAYAWILISIIGAVPLYLSGQFTSYFQAFFEIVSGFTTTGASVLAKPELLPHGVLFWRSFTHWIGGMGVLVFILSIVPMSGGSHMHLMKAESPGPSVSKLTPKVQSTAKILYEIYLVLTVVQVVLLLLGKMPLFDALTTTFGTAGTGGFGIKNDAMASYSPYLQNVTTVFMILFGINFNAYFLILMKRAKQLRYAEEVWGYLAIIGVSIAAIAWNIRHLYGTLEETLRHAAFQVATIITTTGYSTTDFDQWPEFSRTILVILMFIGACAGSTGGGLKVSRVLILCKTIRQEFHYFLHPREVRVLRMEGRPLEGDTVRSVNVYLVTYVLMFTASVLLVSLDNKDLITTFTAVATTFNNVGPGLAGVGPLQNFSHFSDFSKIIMTFDMLAGRLELFPVLLIFFPRTWKRFS